MHIYISGALKASSDLAAARALYEAAAHEIHTAGWKYYLPHTVTDPGRAPDISEKDVFEKDFDAITTAAGVICFLNEPSLGVGAEIEICRSRNIPILGMHRSRISVSRFALGCLLAGRGEVCLYDNWNDAKEYIRIFLGRVPQITPKRAVHELT